MKTKNSDYSGKAMALVQVGGNDSLIKVITIGVKLKDRYNYKLWDTAMVHREELKYKEIIWDKIGGHTPPVGHYEK